MAVFKRRHKVSRARRAAGLLWPSMGWRRLYRYYQHRIGRLPGTPYFIAVGFATGTAVSFTPFIGFHLILSALVTFALRGSLLASVIGATLVGNPWTFPFIWIGTYELGAEIMGAQNVPPLPPDISLDYIWDHFLELLLPMTVGCLPLAAVSWVLVFFLVYGGISSYRDRHRHKGRGDA